MTRIQEALATAIRHHRSGRLKQAASLYRQILHLAPEQPDALHLLGLVAHQSGDHAAAVRSLGKAVKSSPTKALYRFNLGVALAASGHLNEAEERYREAVKLDPGLADAHNNLGLLLQRAGRNEEAAACFRDALGAKPDLAPAHVNLGKLLQEEGRLRDAEEAFRAAVRSKPGLAEAQFCLGKFLEDRLRAQEAEGCYRRALSLKPDFVEARTNLGTALLAQGRYQEAQAVFHELLESGRGGPWWNAEAFDGDLCRRARREPRTIRTTAYKLTDHRDQLAYLVANGQLDPSFTAMAALYDAVRREVEAQAATAGSVTLSRRQARRIESFYDKVVRYADAPRLAGPAVNPGLDFRAIEENYLSSTVSVTHFDDFLTPEALEALRDFCLESTIFFGYNPTGYVTAYMTDGFNCALLYQIADELKKRLPRVLGRLWLANMWGYRYANEGKGVASHTDEAAVTFNFWITPTKANLDPEGGGLVVYAKEQPLDWDWLEVNRKKNTPEIQRMISDFLGDAPTVRIPYRGNRAVLFHSNLFHKSEAFRFREGFENRRMNVSMLFGERGRALA